MTSLIKSKISYLKPLSLVLFFSLLVALFSLCYCFFSSIGSKQLYVEVEYQPSSLKILRLFLDNSQNVPLAPGDSIIEFDHQPLAVALNQGKIELADLIDPPAFNLAKKVYHWPFPPGQRGVLVSLETHSITVEKATGINPTNPRVQVDLSNIQPNKAATFMLIVQLFIGLFFWFTTVILWILRPNEWMTVCFVYYFNLLGLFLLIQLSGQTSRTDPIPFVIGITGICFSPVAFLAFALLFPYGRIISFTGKLTLVVAFIFEFLLFVLTLLINFEPSQTSIELFRNVTNWRLYGLILFAFLALTTLVFHLVKSKGLERVKIRLTVAVFLLVSVIPLIIIIGYALFGLFSNWLTVLNLLCLPLLALPIITLYSIVNYNLFYVDLVIRRSLIYLLLTLILAVLYFTISGLVSLFFSGKQQNEINFFAFLVVSLCVAKAKDYSQRIIDRVFYNGNINYTEQVKKWTVQLYKNSLHLETLLDNIINDLTSDFKYDCSGILILEEVRESDYLHNTEHLVDNLKVDVRHADGFLLTVISPAHTATPPPVVVKPNKSVANKGVLDLLIDWSKLVNLKIDRFRLASYPEWLDFEQEVIELNAKGQQPLCPQRSQPILDIPQLPDLDKYQFLIPFSNQSHISGGLLMGYKLSGQVPTPQERGSLQVISNQIGLALNTALKVQQELTMLQIIQNLCINQENLRLNEHSKVAMELHDTVKQRVSFIDNCLSSWLMEHDEQNDGCLEYEETYLLITDLHKNNREVLTQIKFLIQDLNPQTLPGGLLVNIRQLIARESDQHRDKVIIFNQKMSDQFLLNCFSNEEITSVYRIVQEAVSNALKHSECNFLEVSLCNSMMGSQQVIRLEIVDNGKGFNAVSSHLNRLLLEKHFGLLQMRERTNLLGGQFYLYSSPKGTRIISLFPVNHTGWVSSKI